MYIRDTRIHIAEKIIIHRLQNNISTYFIGLFDVFLKVELNNFISSFTLKLLSAGFRNAPYMWAIQVQDVHITYMHIIIDI